MVSRCLLDRTGNVARDDRVQLRGHVVDRTVQTAPLATMLPPYEALEPILVETENAGPRRNAMPLYRDVVTFQSALQ